jgi:hypothetical protein
VHRFTSQEWAGTEIEIERLSTVAASNALTISSLPFGFLSTQILGNPTVNCADRFQSYYFCSTGPNVTSTTNFSACEACMEAEDTKHSGLMETSACADIVAATCSTLKACSDACTSSECTEYFEEYVFCTLQTGGCDYQCDGISGGNGGSNNGNVGSGTNNGGGSPTGSGTRSNALGISTFVAFAFVPFMIVMLS